MFRLLLKNYAARAITKNVTAHCSMMTSFLKITRHFYFNKKPFSI